MKDVLDRIFGYRQASEDEIRCSGCGEPGNIRILSTERASSWLSLLRTARFGQEIDRAWHDYRCWDSRRTIRAQVFAEPFTGTWAALWGQMAADR